MRRDLFVARIAYFQSGQHIGGSFSFTEFQQYSTQKLNCLCVTRVFFAVEIKIPCCFVPFAGFVIDVRKRARHMQVVLRSGIGMFEQFCCGRVVLFCNQVARLSDFSANTETKGLGLRFWQISQRNE